VPSHAGPLGNSATHFESYYGFNGEDYNSLTGLQYLRARYYEPESGTFLTRDSYLGNITQPLSLNRYAYAMNNPLMYTDPNGHMSLDSEGNSVYSSGNHSNNSSVSSASSLPSGLLRRGSSGDAVKKLQQTLMGLGYDLGSYKDDGIFGSKTEQAVLAFQRNSGITIDGIVGNQTWAALAAAKSRSQSGGNKCDDLTEIGKQETSNSGGATITSGTLDSITQKAINDAKFMLDKLLDKYYAYEWPSDYTIREYTLVPVYEKQYEAEVNKLENVSILFNVGDLASTIKKSFDQASEASSGYIPATAIGTLVFTAMNLMWNEEPGIGDLPDMLGINSAINKSISKALEKTEFIENSIYKYLVYGGNFLWEKGPRGMFIDEITSLESELRANVVNPYNSIQENEVYNNARIGYFETIKNMNVNYNQSISDMNYFLKKIDEKYE
jgi:RHS repeat-associated protein